LPARAPARGPARPPRPGRRTTARLHAPVRPPGQHTPPRGRLGILPRDTAPPARSTFLHDQPRLPGQPSGDRRQPPSARRRPGQPPRPTSWARSSSPPRNPGSGCTRPLPPPRSARRWPPPGCAPSGSLRRRPSGHPAPPGPPAVRHQQTHNSPLRNSLTEETPCNYTPAIAKGARPCHQPPEHPSPTGAPACYPARTRITRPTIEGGQRCAP